MDFIKNYLMGMVLGVIYLPRLLLAAVLLCLPGALVGYLLMSSLPHDAQVLAGIAAVLTSVYVCTSWEPYQRLLERVWPHDGPRDD